MYGLTANASATCGIARVTTVTRGRQESKALAYLQQVGPKAKCEINK
jgi:hypothetical protein